MQTTLSLFGDNDVWKYVTNLVAMTIVKKKFFHNEQTYVSLETLVISQFFF
jgi:hypothetical protein